MSDIKNKPADTLRDRTLKAVIWANATEKGTRYTVDLIRSYQNNAGDWTETHQLSNGEILRGSRLLQLAYDRIFQLRSEEKVQS